LIPADTGFPGQFSEVEISHGLNFVCTPIGHTLAGSILVQNSRIRFRWMNWKWMLGLIIYSNLPDIDFLFGWMKGNPNLIHQEGTHSLAFIMGVSLLTGLLIQMRNKNGWQGGSLCFLILGVHLLFDIFGSDSRPPIGIPLFWPFSEFRVHSLFSIFGSVTKASDNHDFIPSLFCRHNGLVVLREIGIAGLFWGVMTGIRKIR
jgi:membrane-bound metal-dependent hydrolase YbcI (DUF457 family)